MTTSPISPQQTSVRRAQPQIDLTQANTEDATASNQNKDKQFVKNNPEQKKSEFKAGVKGEKEKAEKTAIISPATPLTNTLNRAFNAQVNKQSDESMKVEYEEDKRFIYNAAINGVDATDVKFRKERQNYEQAHRNDAIGNVLRDLNLTRPSDRYWDVTYTPLKYEGRITYAEFLQHADYFHLNEATVSELKKLVDHKKGDQVVVDTRPQADPRDQKLLNKLRSR